MTQGNLSRPDIRKPQFRMATEDSKYKSTSTAWVKLEPIHRVGSPTKTLKLVRVHISIQFFTPSSRTGFGRSLRIQGDLGHSCGKAILAKGLTGDFQTNKVENAMNIMRERLLTASSAM